MERAKRSSTTDDGEWPPVGRWFPDRVAQEHGLTVYQLDRGEAFWRPPGAAYRRSRVETVGALRRMSDLDGWDAARALAAAVAERAYLSEADTVAVGELRRRTLQLNSHEDSPFVHEAFTYAAFANTHVDYVLEDLRALAESGRPPCNVAIEDLARAALDRIEGR